MPVKAIPEGYHSVTPYLIINGAAAALDFYKKAFGATEIFGCRWATRSAMPRSKSAIRT